MRSRKSRAAFAAVFAMSMLAVGATAADASPARTVLVAGKHMVATSTYARTFEANFAQTHPGWTKMTWGGTATGSATNAALPAVPAANWSCSLYVGPVTLPNGVNGNLQAETDQTCSGAFGKQQTRADFARSSWSGYRLYASTVYSGQTTSTFLTTTFTVDCGGGGQGTYNYRLEAQGYAVPSGWTSTTASYGGSQPQRFPCGT